jgi:hypothetical protein
MQARATARLTTGSTTGDWRLTTDDRRPTTDD